MRQDERVRVSVTWGKKNVTTGAQRLAGTLSVLEARFFASSILEEQGADFVYLATYGRSGLKVVTLHGGPKLSRREKHHQKILRGSARAGRRT